jgi:glycosyltransferase involved in cell wall biosynthesis
MSQKPQLTVLLSFQNQRDEIESCLTSLYELETIPFELIIIDDASTDGSEQAILSLLDYYKHEQTFFFEHSRPMGRGNSLNEALQQAGSDIIWAPHSFRSVNEEQLRKAIKKLHNKDVSCIAQNTSLPRHLDEWTERIRRGRLPNDGQILWNIAKVPSSQCFFSPFLNCYNGAEWLIRLGIDALEIDKAFFAPSAFKKHPKPSSVEQQELLMALLRRRGIASQERRKLTDMLRDLSIVLERQTPAERNHDLLEKAVRLKLKGQLTAALEYVEQALQHEPGNHEAKHLKIKLLERKRRFVEASELKHELQSRRSGVEKGQGGGSRIKTSLIIPTALYGRAALEHALVSVDKHCTPDHTELIIIDNASLDDTHEYLQELKEKQFFNCRIITNSKNRGFAASVNQGLDAAKGQYACIMHNDMELDGPAVVRLEHLMDHHPDYALMGPLADSTLNPAQLVSNKDEDQDGVIEADYLDSFFMMFRTETGIRMDEAYTLAFFEDIDFSFEVRKQGYKAGIAPEVQLTHHYGTTTFALGLDTESPLYWKNIATFNDKWDIQAYSEKQLEPKEEVEQLIALDEWVNPLYPESSIQKKFEALFTEELRTEILKTDYDSETLFHLIHLLMVMKKRDVLRRLEERIDDMEMPRDLIYEMARFYFKRSVYSRCQHYLSRLTERQESLQSDLYRLAMLIDEKKMGEAVPLLTDLLKKAPSNPLLYKLSGDMHSFEGNNEEADSFYSLAYQINPFEFEDVSQEVRID